MGLFPTFDVPQITTDTQSSTPDPPSSIFFDEKTGDLLLDGEGRLITATPKEAWEQWCIKAVATERYAFLGYSNQLGVEIEPAFKLQTKEAKESAIHQTITECLLADPYKRTETVGNFVFSWGVDSLTVSFTVTGSNGNAKLTVEYEVK